MPENSELMVSSEFCPIAGFQTDNMLGIQGHPEFDQEYSSYLFDRYGDTLDAESKEKTIHSFDQQPNSDVVGAWMVNFIKNQIAMA